MKKIIERNLPLSEKYFLIDKKYIPLVDRVGMCCDNCNKLISNIATVKSESNKTYNVGFDCLETFLINNNLLDGKSIEDYSEYKKQLPTLLKKAKEISEVIKETNKKNINKVVSLLLEISDFDHCKRLGKNTYLTFYYVSSNGKKYNDNVRISSDTNIKNFLELLKQVAKIELTTL